MISHNGQSFDVLAAYQSAPPDLKRIISIMLESNNSDVDLLRYCQSRLPANRAHILDVEIKRAQARLVVDGLDDAACTALADRLDNLHG